MRIANLAGTLALVHPDGRRAAKIGGDPQSAYGRVAELSALGLDDSAYQTFDPADLGCPVPEPGQLVAIGLNYRAHAIESNLPLPAQPMVFTKFRSSLAGPFGQVRLPSETVDWEVELAVVIGRSGHQIAPADAWDHIAGMAVAQDLSDRTLQMASTPAQFSLGKSWPGFCPLGPWVVTPDELADPDDLRLSCSINGETVQDSRTNDLIFPISELISHLSTVLTLQPGDVILTGTPSGVGMGRTPQRWLQDGDVLSSEIEGLGRIEQRFVR